MTIWKQVEYQKNQLSSVSVAPELAKVESYLKEYNNPNNIVYEDVEELENAFNDDEEEKREYKNRNIAKKILAIIPFAMTLIIIICGIILG